MKITFYKNALNSYDEPYECLLTSYCFPANISEEIAIEKAIKSFQIECKCEHWKDLADYYRIE